MFVSPYEVGNTAEYLQHFNYNKHLNSMSQIWTNNASMHNDSRTKSWEQDVKNIREISRRWNYKQFQNGVEANNLYMLTNIARINAGEYQTVIPKHTCTFTQNHKLGSLRGGQMKRQREAIHEDNCKIIQRIIKAPGVINKKSLLKSSASS